MSECKVMGCTGKVVSKGMCDKHRKRMERHGHTKRTRPDDWGKRERHPLYKYWVDNIRRTPFLLSEEWFDDFWCFAGDVGERPENHHIKPLMLNKKLGPDNYAWIPSKPKKFKGKPKSPLRKNNNKIYLSRQKRILMYEDVGYKCEICGLDESVESSETKNKSLLCIDHCHDSMKIRGVLCRKCNSALGLLGDSVGALSSAIKYLKKHK